MTSPPTERDINAKAALSSTGRLINMPRAVEKMQAAGLDALIATSPENVTYSTGFWSLSQWLRRSVLVAAIIPVRRTSDSVLILPSGNADLLESDAPWVDDIRRYGDFPLAWTTEAIDHGAHYPLLDAAFARPAGLDAISSIVEAVRDLGLDSARLGLDETGLTPIDYEALKGRLPGAAIEAAGSVFRSIRAVKTSEEIRRLRAAANLAESAIDSAMAIIREGVTERALAEAVLGTFAQAGATPANIAIGAGIQSAFPNAQASDYRIRRGDIIRFDIGCRYQHYRSDISRCAVLGEAPSRVRQFYDAVEAGEQRAIALARAGVTAAELFHAAVDTVRSTGIPGYARHHVGHGIGIEGYDVPNLAPHDATPLEDGMVLCIETPYYELGWGGVQVEDTVRVGVDGPETLMKKGPALLAL